VVFIETGIISLLSTTTRGEVIEAALIGREGVVGATCLLHHPAMPYRATVEMDVDALVVPVEILERLLPRLPTLYEGMLRSLHLLLMQVSQTAVCNRFHASSQRLARWLLACRDRAGTDTLNLTHEVLAHMVGVPRTWVTRIAGQLQREGLVHYRRGVIAIADPVGLARRSCDCYEILRRDLEQYLKS
jgi:CRP-like cAMP-binding protein